MALFQKSVLANHLNSITEKEILSGWEKFQNYKSISENIRTYKEEEFQYKFLEMLFVDCLGYKISDVGDEKRNLFTEVKNVSDSKKADGAIKKDDEVIAVIELKSTKTKDFKKIQEQAFGYKVNQPKCKYVITSNFEKLRFYINDATEFEEFDLFNLTQHDFKLLHVCLHINNIFNDIPEKLKTDSVFEEENITKKLYKDYSAFRKEVFNSLVENNTEYDKLLLFNKTQKLLDRFLFIFFAEDRNLLPVNSISEIIKVWENDRSFYGQRSLYEVYKGYFKVLNNGRPASEGRESIFAYNGGLFAEDEVLNSIKIDDKILLRHTKNLSHYDFESDVSVNILGHIFEHSLTEIEEIQNEISGIETGTSKRKKDGVFYTPQYITKYIVENSLGKLCNEKKIELDINEETYAPSSKRSRERIQILENYRNWLLGLTICDPACGSGAFLNQALSFLIEEHKYVDELSAKYNKDSLVLSDVKSSILENNLFGVDINEESVEIAKLSLWLRTAEKGRKLTSLNNNLKCGNSLVDDPEIEGDKAFDWQNEFPKVFVNGGFDVVIGNPPWVSLIGKHGQSIQKSTLEFLIKKYNGNTYMPNLFEYFISLSHDITKTGGINSLIVPDRFGLNEVFKKLRKYLIDNSKIIEIIYKWDFPGIITDTMTYVFVKKKSNIDYKFKIRNRPFSSYVEFQKSEILNTESFDFKPFENKLTKDLLTKLLFNKTLKDYFKSTSGFGGKSKLITENKISDNQIKILKGRSIDRYVIKKSLFFHFNDDNVTGRTRDKEKLGKKIKILIRKTGNTIIATFDNSGIFPEQSLYFIYDFKNEEEAKSILALFNSKLYSWIYIKCFVTNLDSTPQLKNVDLYKFPIKFFQNQELKSVVEIVNSLLLNNKNLQTISSKFLKLLQSEFVIQKLNKKLENWYEFEWFEFEQELKKKKIILLGVQKDDWFDRFSRFKEDCQQLITQIENSEKILNTMVYKLYDLNVEEINTVENN